MTRSPHPCVPTSFGLLLLIGVGGCGTDDPSGALGTESVTLMDDDIEILGTSDQLSRVRDLEVAADGSIWILDNHPPFFVSFDADGAEGLSHGNRGQGPGEFGSPNALVRVDTGDPDVDGIWSYDFSRHALTRIDRVRASGREEPVIALPRDEIAQGSLLSFREAGMGASRPWVESVDGGIVIARSRAGSGTASFVWTTDLLSVSPSGETTHRAAIADLIGRPPAQYADAVFMLPVPLWTYCPDGTLLVMAPASNELRAFSPDGLDRVPRSLPPERRVPLTADAVWAMVAPSLLEMPTDQRPPLDEARASFDAEFAEVRSQLANVLPEYADLRCTGDNTAWLQLFDSEGGPMGHGPWWLRIAGTPDDDGRHEIRRVRFPDSFTPFRFTAGHAWGIVLDELHLPSPARVVLP